MVKEHNTFAEALEKATGERHLLAGNGLSMAFDPESFSYNYLFDAADLETDYPQIAEVFKSLGTKDFERVANALESAAQISHGYGKADFEDKLRDNIEILKKRLIESVKKKHPENGNCIQEDQAKNFQSFLLKFIETNGKVYSLNYDALLYWAILKGHRQRPIAGKYADGFGIHDGNDVIFMGDSCARPVNILFPHGALFLFERDGEVFKPSARMRDASLIDIITDNMNEGFYPLFVSEGTTSQKQQAIRRSFYLNYCFENIAEAKDNFFIFGHSLDLQTDGHILLKIANNTNIKRIFGSYFNNKDHVIGKLHEIKHQSEREDLEIHVYPADTVNCW